MVAAGAPDDRQQGRGGELLAGGAERSGRASRGQTAAVFIG